MKALLCALCNEIHSLPKDGAAICRCGNVSAWWTDSQRGIAKVYSKYREYARIIGIHNGFLQAAFPESGNSPGDELWRKITKEICDSAEGYLFHKDKRNCPVAIIAIGQSNDVSWSETPYEAPEENKP